MRICVKEKKKVEVREVAKKEMKKAVFKQRREESTWGKENYVQTFFVKIVYFKLLAATASGTGTYWSQ